MGAKNIYLIGFDFVPYSKNRVHLDSKIDSRYAYQKISPFSRHKQGIEWLIIKLKKYYVNVINLSSKLSTSPDILSIA
jgi:hypothetical protein